MKKLVLLLAVFCASVHAEVLFGIQYSATLGMVKKLYPNAEYVQLKPAWLQPNEAFFKIGGTGMSGSLYVAFSDLRPFWATYSEDDAKAVLERLGTTPTDELVKSHMNTARNLAAESDDDGLFVKWVRWIPVAPIPLSKLEVKYGKATCSLDQSFDTACVWLKWSLRSTMTADGKSVVFLETDFTEAEQKRGLELRSQN